MNTLFAVRFYFIAFSLSLCLGIPGQARAASEGGCDGRSMIHRKLVTGDTLSQISQEVYGKGDRAHYQRIVDANPGKIKDPRWIYAEDTIAIPCAIPITWELVVIAPSADAPEMLIDAPAAFLAPVQMATLTLPVAIPRRATIPVPVVKTQQPQKTPNVEPTERVSTSADGTLTPTATHAPISPGVNNAPAGWYEIELAPSQVRGISAGQFPAIALADQTSKGFWRKRSKTVSTVSRAQNGNFIVKMDFRPAPPSAHSAIAIDLGKGNLVHIGGEVVARDGRIVGDASEQSLPKRFERSKYSTLNDEFLKKPPLLLAMARKAIPVAGPAGIGFLVGGPLGAGLGGGIPIIRSFLTSKILRAQSPPSEAIPHVQYVLADQADRIGTLEAKMADLQDQLNQLSTLKMADAKTKNKNQH